MSPSTDGPTPEIHEAAGLVHRYLEAFVLPPADYRQQCTRECRAASARPRLSRLLLPQANASAHFFVRYGALCVGIREATSDHGVKGKLPDELFPRAILRLLLNQTRQFFLGRGHWRYLQFVLKGATDNHLMEWHITICRRLKQNRTKPVDHVRYAGRDPGNLLFSLRASGR